MRKPYDTSIEAGRGELRRKLAASLCSVALLFNILCGVALSVGFTRTSVAAEARAGWIVVCTAAGPVAVPADGNPALRTGADDPAAALAPVCVFCLPLMHGDAALAGVVALSAPAQMLELRRLPPSALLAAPRPSAFQAWARAPPFLSIG